jgi:sugar/nucleoside kinase (ribokinase family)
MGRTECYEVLLFDGYFCDLIVTGLPEMPRLGADLFGTAMGIHAGGTFNVARALHRLGVRAGWVCDFGNDLFSQFVLSEVRREGVDTGLFRFHDRPIRAFSLAFSYSDDRGFISFMDPVEPYPRSPYILELRPRCVLLQNLEVGPDFRALVEAAGQVGAQVCMDCQSTNLTLETPGVVEALEMVDLFLPNAGEARRLTGADTTEAAADILAGFCPLVVIKQGACGALARTRELQIQSPALDVAVLDTTGAGDCFNAGFLYSHLRGDPLETSLRYGNICGGLSTTTHGTEATPTAAEIEDLATGAGRAPAPLPQ